MRKYPAPSARRWAMTQTGALKPSTVILSAPIVEKWGTPRINGRPFYLKLK